MKGTLFVYENVRVDDNRRRIYFDYRIETDEKNFSLTETLDLPTELPDNDTINRLLRSLHIALGISYYKTFVPPEINHDYLMDKPEADFWNNVFRHGLGEFLYKNGLDSDQLAKFKAYDGNIHPGSDDSIDFQEHALLGIGGGKDSIVAGELMKAAGIPVTGFVLATADHRGQAQAVADIMQVDMLAVERRLDPQIIELNKMPGAYNGHIPISLIFALVGCLLGVLQKSSYIVVANEASASIPQVSYKGTDINHQWSKSLEFEKLFQAFVHDYLSVHLQYTSVVRPFTSIAVAKLFSNYPQYFETFTSDNSHFKMNATDQQKRWNPHSTKTLSSFLLLAPWLDEATTLRIFETELAQDESLHQMLIELLGKGAAPILDCVGTPDELRLCLSILSEQRKFTGTPLISFGFQEQFIFPATTAPLEEALRPSDEHAVPKALYDRIMEIARKLL